MTNVIWMLSLSLQVLTAMSKLPMPTNLTLTSKRFIHLLTWKPGKDTPPDTYYNVWVHAGRDGRWVVVCGSVRSPLFCNLTEHFPNPRLVYYTRVQAVLGSNVSEPLQHGGLIPLKETEMEQPLLTVAACEPGSLCVDLQPPEERLRSIYQTLHYHLRRFQNSSPEPATFLQEGLKHRILKALVPGRHCVSVSFYVKDLQRESNFSQPVCAFITDLPAERDIKIVALLCALVVFVSAVVAVGLFLPWWAGFLCLKTVLPSVLMDITNNPKEEQFHPKEKQLVLDGLISLVFVESASPSTCGKGNNNNRQSEEGYNDEGETEQGSPSGSRGDGYTSRPGPLSPSPSSSSSSSSTTGRSSTSFEPVGSDQHAVPLLEGSNGVRDLNSSHLLPTPPPLQPQLTGSAPLPETNPHGSSEAYEMTLRPRTVGLDALAVGVARTKADEVAKKDSGQVVNLWSLTFGGHEQEEVSCGTPAPPPSDGEEKVPGDASSTPLLLLPSQEEVAMETVAASEEEDEECCGYMKR